jgi:hypothetical protein
MQYQLIDADPEGPNHYLYIIPSQFRPCVPCGNQFRQFLHVVFHCVVLGHLAQLFPGTPLHFFNYFEPTRGLGLVFTRRDLLEQRVEVEFLLVREFWLAWLGCITSILPSEGMFLMNSRACWKSSFMLIFKINIDSGSPKHIIS